MLLLLAAMASLAVAQEGVQVQSVPQQTALRMVGYLEAWAPMPPIATLKHYSHVMYAFISATDNTCRLHPPNQTTVDYLHSAGVLVLGSLGGAAMGQQGGGFWAGCTVDTLVTQLTVMVQTYKLDGIDIDYEVTPPIVAFVSGLHNGLRSALPKGALLTHTPENFLMGKSQPYWNILQNCTGIDFISVQYYNNDPAPSSDPQGATDHYKYIINFLFGGNPTKVVFGFCITACPGYPSYPNSTNMDGPTTAAFVQKYLAVYGSYFGGVMNYAINQGDVDGVWSSTVLAAFPGGGPPPPPSPPSPPSPPPPAPSPPPPPPPPSPPAPGDNYCGTTWSDAAAHCNTCQKCISHDSECPTNQHCYTGITCSPATNFCGISWSDADTNCATAAHCISQDSECPTGQHCYTGITCPSAFRAAPVYKGAEQ